MFIDDGGIPGPYYHYDCFGCTYDQAENYTANATFVLTD